jgi:hypothetical protein
MVVRIDTLIRELNTLGILSTRAVNICGDQNLLYVVDLIQFSISGGSFGKMRNCGLKTQVELEDFCSRYAFLMQEIDGTTETDSVLSPNDSEESFVNLKLNKLTKKHNWSRRTRNFCLKMGIGDLKALIDFSVRNGGSFDELSYCSRKTELELKETIDFYSSLKPRHLINQVSEIDLNLAIAELSVSHNWSIRTTNCCLYEGISDLRGLILYFNRHQSFLTLKNCGKKTNNELLAAMHFYTLEKTRSRSRVSEFIGLKNVLTRELITMHEGLNLSRIVKRGLLDRNIISIFDCINYSLIVGREKNSVELEIEDFIRIVIENYSEAIALYGILNSADAQILENSNASIACRSSYEPLFKVASARNSRLLDLPDFKFLNSRLDEGRLLQLTTCLMLDLNTNIDYDVELNSYLKLLPVNGFGVFSFLNFYVLRNKSLNLIHSKTLSFIATVNNYDGNMQVLADECSLSRERIRQLKDKYSAVLMRKLDVLNLIMSSGLLIRNYLYEESIIHIDRSFSEMINSDENSEFNEAFIALVIYKLYKNDYELLVFQGEELVSPTWSEKLFKYRKHDFYFVRHEILSQLSIKAFINQICERRVKSRNTDQNIPLSYLVSSCLKPDAVISDEVLSLATLIAERFEKVFVSDIGILVFESNFHQQLRLAILETLQRKEEPMMLPEIQNELLKKISVESITLARIRRAMSDRTTFVSYGLSGYYGLNNWDLSVTNGKINTIVKLVKDFLISCNSPQHISIILSSISNYRSTSPRSIETMIRMDNGETFITYGGGYYGLLNVHPKKSEFKVKPIVGGHFHKESLQRFRGWKFDNVVKVISSENGYFKEQVQSVLIDRLQNGDFSLDDEGCFDFAALKPIRDFDNSNTKELSIEDPVGETFEDELLNLILPPLKNNNILKAIEYASFFYNERGQKFTFVQMKNLIDIVRSKFL